MCAPEKFTNFLVSGIQLENMMKPPRRRFLSLAARAAAVPVVSRFAKAEAYPTRPVRMIVPFAPGGGTDLAARLMGQWLSERLGQQFVIENRPGAGGNIGTEAVVHAPADGYTLLVAGLNDAVNATLYPKLNFVFLRDIVPVASIVRFPLVVVVPPSFPSQTIPEFILYAKANPGKVNMASAGSGTPNHMAGELFKMMTGADMVHVPYRGAGPALTDMLGGQVQVMFATTAAAIEYVKAGRLRALAVTTEARSAALPDTPTLAEFVRGYEASFWAGIGAPKGTPVEIIDKLNREINAALADEKMRARFADFGGVVFVGSPAEFARLISRETEKWAKVVRAGNISAD
jgi:tripartite-type tricarboxylate transporter receptor subunit TctC